MNQNLKKMISYYKPYRAVFAADMLFATLSAAVALTIPLVVRYVTSTLNNGIESISMQYQRDRASGNRKRVYTFRDQSQ